MASWVPLSPLRSRRLVVVAAPAQRWCCVPLVTVLPMGSYPCGRRRCPRWVNRCRYPQAATPMGIVPAGATLEGDAYARR
ncbi:hypothetical protein GW17_00003194 [Ensete ventricosum]|nr:hypothetical protein GW17_00003194 [Ensete ventricosum]